MLRSFLRLPVRCVSNQTGLQIAYRALTVRHQPLPWCRSESSRQPTTTDFASPPCVASLFGSVTSAKLTICRGSWPKHHGDTWDDVDRETYTRSVDRISETLPSPTFVCFAVCHGTLHLCNQVIHSLEDAQRATRIGGDSLTPEIKSMSMAPPTKSWPTNEHTSCSAKLPIPHHVLGHGRIGDRQFLHRD